METSLVKINRFSPEKDRVALAASILRRGGVVAFPTDTMYALGVDIFDEGALKMLYRIKGRQIHKPIAVVIADKEKLKLLVSFIPEDAGKLMENFWPGPLTIVFKAQEKLSPLITGNSGKVGLRIPENRIAISLIEECGFPITSTSANISGQSSSLNKDEVLEQLGGKIDMVVDGGPSPSSVPSTVVDASSGNLSILREGMIGRDELAVVLGKDIVR